MKKEDHTIPLTEFLEHLKPFIDNGAEKYDVSFSGLDFYRTKLRSDTRIQIEFNEIVYRDKNDNVVVENP